MNLINNNPYRILGLPITANEKEIARQFNTLATYAEMGKTKLSDNDYPFLTPVNRTKFTIEEAKKQIEQDDAKLLYSLFWFWENNSADELALEVLKEGNTDKAIDIWEKVAFTNKHKIYKPIVLNENLIASSTQFNDTADEDHILKKDGDQYFVERKKEENYSIPTAFYELNFEDNWSIECNVKWMDGVDTFSYGIVFGRAKGSYYYFGIAGSGSYMYGKYDDWTYTKYIDWTENKNFNKWGTNKLRIEKIENTLKFFINDEHVNNWEAEPFFGEYFGFKVTKNQKVSFRNLKFCKLIEDEIYGEGLIVSLKNLSNIKNLSTLYLSLSLASTKGTFKINHFEKGIALAKYIFANGNIEEFSKLIVDDKYNYKPEKTLHFYINDILESVKPFIDKEDGIPINKLINSFATFPIEAKHILNNRFVAKQIQNIDQEIEKAQTARRNDPKTAIDTGQALVSNTKTDILHLKNILDESDFQYQIIADKLSLAIMQCGIESFNVRKTEKGEIDYPNAIKSEERFVQEYEYALSIAVSQRVKERVKENLESCKELIKDKHFYHCWFCGKNPPSISSKFEITIYKETYRSYFPRRVEFSYVPIAIPRCSKCKDYHDKTSNKITLIPIGGAIVGCVIAALISEGGEYWFLGLVVGGAIGWFIKEGLKSQELSKSIIKDTSQSTISKYPELHKKIIGGWKFSKPSA